MRGDLERRFDEEMMSIYLRAKSEANYHATLFHQMLIRDRGVATAKRLINSSKPSEGYTALWERGRLDLTVEALVASAHWCHPLFSPQDIDAARRRLLAYRYRLE